MVHDLDGGDLLHGAIRVTPVGGRGASCLISPWSADALSRSTVPLDERGDSGARSAYSLLTRLLALREIGRHGRASCSRHAACDVSRPRAFPWQAEWRVQGMPHHFVTRSLLAARLTYLAR